ncbi:ribonuclease H-like domain-containing protein [Tanacetum coccineum]
MDGEDLSLGVVFLSGGRTDEGDTTDVPTVLREVEEEIGVVASKVSRIKGSHNYKIEQPSVNPSRSEQLDRLLAADFRDVLGVVATLGEQMDEPQSMKTREKVGEKVEEVFNKKIPNAKRGSIGDVGDGENADEFLEGVGAAEEDDSGMAQFELAFTFSAALRLNQTCCQLCERSSSTKETVGAHGYEVDLENVRVGYTHGGQFARSGGEQSAARLLTDHVLIGHSSNAFDILCKQGTHMVTSLLDPEANKVQQDGLQQVVSNGGTNFPVALDRQDGVIAKVKTENPSLDTSIRQDGDPVPKVMVTNEGIKNVPAKTLKARSASLERNLDAKALMLAINQSPIVFTSFVIGAGVVCNGQLNHVVEKAGENHHDGTDNGCVKDKKLP